MPLPKPTEGESKQDFIARFITNEAAKEKFPEEVACSAEAERVFAANAAEPHTRKITINSKTSGRYKTRVVGGAKHMITEMVPLVGDTVMKGLLYPLDEVIKSFNQFTNLPAPAGHPMIEGKKVSAFHPMAVNAFNVGGFTRNPKMDGKKVVTEFWLNTDVAGHTDDGKELMRRIKEGEQVGVSTGLDASIVSSNGVGDDGEKYRATLSNFQFDHVAVLLDEEAAGSHVGTELLTNDDGEEVILCSIDNQTTVNEMMDMIGRVLKDKFATDTKSVWLRDFIIDDNNAVYEVSDSDLGNSQLFKVEITKVDGEFMVSGIPIPVEEQTSFIPLMNKEGKPNLEEEDMEFTIENTTEFLVNLGKKVVDPSELITPEQVTELAAYAENKEGFEAYMAEQSTVLNAKRTECIAASGLKEADVEGLTVDAMDIIINKCKVSVDNSARGGGKLPEVTEESKAEAASTASTFMSGTSADKE